VKQSRLMSLVESVANVIVGYRIKSPLFGEMVVVNPVHMKGKT